MEHSHSSNIRHELRTLLNHISGYSDLLREDCGELGHPELRDIFASVFRMTETLRDGLAELYRDAPEDMEKFNKARNVIMAQLFDVVSLGHSAKRIANRDGKAALLPDIEKILDSSDRIVDIVENRVPTDSPEESALETARVTALRGQDRKESETFGKASVSGRILIIDDDEINRHIMSRQLERQGHTVVSVVNGREAIALLKRVPFDIILLDVMMPEMNGFQVLELLKQDERLRDMPVIVISALEDSKAMARCIEMGAEDYLPREFDPIILRARIASILDRAQLRRDRDRYVAAIVETQKHLQAELSDAAKYVRTLLPAPRGQAPCRTAWSFIPSLSLGGDIFGYHDRPDGKFVIYLIDVSGHGIEAALLSVTIMNLLKAETLPNTDFSNPAKVLSTLNGRFPSDEQNNMYFTIWYGVFDPATRRLEYSSAGNSSAVLVAPSLQASYLQTEGIVIGVDEGFPYQNHGVDIPSGSRLYIFSDGIYEIRDKQGSMLGMEDFIGILKNLPAGATAEARLSSLVSTVRDISMSGAFEDDISIIEATLG